jgi:hypothetical protein
MTTQYSLSDTLPKDAGGAKFAGWVDISTSQNDFALPKGIGSLTANSKIFANLAIGTHVGGSKVDHPVVGVLGMAHFASNASIVGTMGAVPVRGDDRGEIYQSALSSTASMMSGSTETVSLASGILYRMIVAGCGVQAAAQVAVLNGATSLAHVVFSGANETLPVLDFGTGACFASLRYERRNTVGVVYITSIFKGYGQ